MLNVPRYNSSEIITLETITSLTGLSLIKGGYYQIFNHNMRDILILLIEVIEFKKINLQIKLCKYRNAHPHQNANA